MPTVAQSPWTDDLNPEEDGWYAVLLSWDPGETSAGGELRKDGAWGLQERAIDKRSPEPFASEQEARDWAYDHSDDW